MVNMDPKIRLLEIFPLWFSGPSMKKALWNPRVVPYLFNSLGGHFGDCELPKMLRNAVIFFSALRIFLIIQLP